MTASLIGLGLMVLALVSGIPIALAMGVIGVVGFALIIGWDPALVMTGQIVADTLLNFSFATLPLFVLMGNLIGRAGLSEELYAASNAFLGHRRGGLAMATVVASGAFGAVCGSSMATAATMGRVALPSMKRYGYDDGFAAASVAAGGTLGIIIPPSIPMILYGFMTDTDVGKLFIAGVLPGLLAVTLYALAVVATTRLFPRLGPPVERTPWHRRWAALSRVWGLLLLFSVVLGGIYFGVFTPNEAAGIGAFGALLFALARRGLTWRIFFSILVDSAKTSSTMFFLLVGALLFSNFLNISGGAAALSGLVGDLDVHPVVVILVIILIYLVLGCLLESLSMMLLTVPIFAPIVAQLGVDMIWFGIIVVMSIEIGLITPPVGLNVFVLKATQPDLPVMRVFRAILPFFAADVIRIGLIIAFPAIALFLPSLM